MPLARPAHVPGIRVINSQSRSPEFPFTVRQSHRKIIVSLSNRTCQQMECNTLDGICCRARVRSSPKLLAIPSKGSREGERETEKRGRERPLRLLDNQVLLFRVNACWICATCRFELQRYFKRALLIFQLTRSFYCLYVFLFNVSCDSVARFALSKSVKSSQTFGQEKNR